MPILDSQIEVFRLCVRINRLRYQIVRDYRMTSTPKLQSLAKEMAMMESGLEDGAGQLLTKIQAVNTRGLAALAKGHQKVDAKASLVTEIEGFVTALEGSNGGDPLDDSSATSAASATVAPASVAPATTAAPEQLTVNGVSKS
jgi:hypothetical protein